jgi:hypothetical protein
MMGLDLWFQQDVIRILAALASAGRGRHLAYHEALRDVALAFGLNVTMPMGEAGDHAMVIMSGDEVSALSDDGRTETIQNQRRFKPHPEEIA